MHLCLSGSNTKLCAPPLAHSWSCKHCVALYALPCAYCMVTWYHHGLFAFILGLLILKECWRNFCAQVYHFVKAQEAITTGFNTYCDIFKANRHASDDRCYMQQGWVQMVQGLCQGWPCLQGSPAHQLGVALLLVAPLFLVSLAHPGAPRMTCWMTRSLM